MSELNTLDDLNSAFGKFRKEKGYKPTSMILGVQERIKINCWTYIGDPECGKERTEYFGLKIVKSDEENHFELI